MATIPCPGCRTDLEPSATSCHICLRGRSKLEITRAYATLREMEKQRKQRPFIITGRVLAAAAIGWALFRFQKPILGALSAASAFGTKTMNDLLYPAPPPKPAAAPAQTAAQAPAEAASPSPFNTASAPSTPHTQTPASAASPSAPPFDPHAAPPVAKRRRSGKVADLPLPYYDQSMQWAFYGRAFDLLTLEPVADAQLVFGVPNLLRTGTDMAAQAHTDEDGRFVVVLRRQQEGTTYEIRVFRAGYAAPVLYESDIPYATLPLADRREIIRNAQDGDMTLPPLTDGGESAVRRDVFLAPGR